ncbi:MAG: SMC-Scp complex subunit ScpB [candidate division Zixibacteria bacterium RBG_16_40_9]|nr:MAG: SMC-Scp complex subunit ScpB [candidate division Zixibacteria bacterium RBG_16_40_9]
MENNWDKILEAMLFSADEPLTLEKISGVLSLVSPDQIQAIIDQLNQKYNDNGHSFRIREVGGGFQVYTLPEYATWIENLWKKTRWQRLSRAALETLAIVAYRQPMVKAEIDKIRGVLSDGTLRTLLERNLIEIKGREKSPGRPLLYQTTEKFLSFFGINDLKELPQLKELKTVLEAENLSGKDELDLEKVLPSPLVLDNLETPQRVFDQPQGES